MVLPPVVRRCAPLAVTAALFGCAPSRGGAATAQAQMRLNADLVATLVFDNNPTLSPSSPVPSIHETASVVLPPGANPACPSGRVLVGHGSGLAALLSADLRCLSDPSAAGCLGGPGVSEVGLGVPAEVIPTKRVCEAGRPCVCTTEKTAPRYVRAGTDTTLVRHGVGGLVQVYSAYQYAPDAACSPVETHAVNIVRRSDDCGATWSMTVVDATVIPHDPSFCSNLDMPWLYADAFPPGGSPEGAMLYLLGGAGFSCKGGVNATVLFRSADGGRSWQGVQAFRSKGQDVLFSNSGITTMPDGAVVVSGCGYQDKGNVNEGRPVVFYSYDFGVSFSEVEASPPRSVPYCGAVNAFPTAENRNFMPGGLGSFVTSSSLSRVIDPGSDSNTVRLAYSSLEPDPQGGLRQIIQIANASFPKRGRKGQASLQSVGALRPLGPADSIFHASFVEADASAPPPLTDRAVLWWGEGSQPSGEYVAAYRLVSGASDYGPPALLSVKRQSGGGVTPVSWRPNLDCSRDKTVASALDPKGGLLCWAGEYDRGSYFFDRATGRSMFFLQWPQSHPDVAGHNEFLHYNVVSTAP